MPETPIPTMQYNPKETGKRIQQLRKKKKLSQEQLAEQLNVSVNTIAKIECGLRTPSVDLLVDLAEFFDVSLEYLILGKVFEELDKETELQSIDKFIQKIEDGIVQLLSIKEKLIQRRKELENQ